MSALRTLFSLWDLLCLAGFPLLLAVHLRLQARHARAVELLRECQDHLNRCGASVPASPSTTSAAPSRSEQP